MYIYIDAYIYDYKARNYSIIESTERKTTSPHSSSKPCQRRPAQIIDCFASFFVNQWNMAVDSTGRTSHPKMMGKKARQPLCFKSFDLHCGLQHGQQIVIAPQRSSSTCKMPQHLLPSGACCFTNHGQEVLCFFRCSHQIYC